jgi:uncharacterized protein (TIGR02246 family)
MRSVAMKREVKVFVLAALLATAAQESFAADPLHQTIQEREDQWSAAFNAHDEAGLAAIYAEDAVLLPPGSMPVKGRSEIGKVLASLFAQIRDIKLVADEVRPLGADHAVEIGHSEYQAVGKDGKQSPTADNYVVVWQKADDGVWYYVTDIFNSR